MNIPAPYCYPEYHAFIRRLREDDHDLPRLVLADWLEERGEPERAELIRLQVELHRNGPTMDQAKRQALMNRESELLKLRGFQWASLPENSEGIGYGVNFERGFLVNLECHVRVFHRHGIDICKVHPVKKLQLLMLDPTFAIDRTVNALAISYASQDTSTMIQRYSAHQMLSSLLEPYINTREFAPPVRPVQHVVMQPSRILFSDHTF